MTTSEDLSKLKTMVTSFQYNPDDTTHANSIKDLIIKITNTRNHEAKAQLIEILTEAFKYGDKYSTESKNFFHVLLSSTIELDVKRQIAIKCRDIEINDIYLASHANKADSDLKFPLDYAMDKAYARMRENMGLNDAVATEIAPFMTEDPKSNRNGFDSHTTEFLGSFPGIIVEEQNYYFEQRHKYVGCKLERNSESYYQEMHKIAKESMFSEDSFLKLNDTINKISVKVALLNKEELQDTASQGFREHAFPRIQCIKALYGSLSQEEKGKVAYKASISAFPDPKSIDLFIQDEFPPLNNIDELLGLVPSGESAAAEM